MENQSNRKTLIFKSKPFNGLHNPLLEECQKGIGMHSIDRKNYGT